MNLSAAGCRSYAVDHATGVAASFSGLAAYPRVPRVSSAEEVVEAGQAPVGSISKFARPVVEVDESPAAAVQSQGRTLQVVERQAPQLLWMIGEMKVSSTRAK